MLGAWETLDFEDRRISGAEWRLPIIYTRPLAKTLLTHPWK